MNKQFQQALSAYKVGRLPEALRLAKSAVGKSGPAESGVQALLGNIHFKLGERRPAADAFVRAAKGMADRAPEFLKLAITLYEQEGAIDRIVEVGPRAVEANPGDSDLAFSVGNVFFGNGLRGDMTPIIRRLDRANDRHMALIINWYRLTGRYEELYAELEAQLADDPHNAFLRMSRFAVAREVLDFKAMEEHETIMRTPDAQPAPRLLSQESALGRILWCADEAINALPTQESNRHSLALTTTGPTPRRAFSPAGRITVGYLSNDFFDHATMTLFREAMARHDRERFDVVLLSYTEATAARQQQDWPGHLRDAVVPILEMSDQEACDFISRRGIDILVDLKGPTMGGRLGIVNRSDAPVKAAYLGFPGSIAGVDLDYAITDPVVTPDTSRPHWAEKLCRLPETYQANNWQTRARPQPMERADVGLPEDAFVFASFNSAWKITSAALSLWAEVLRAVPDAVFWVLCPNPLARRNLARALEDRGVRSSRLVFTEMQPYPAHVSRLPLADLALDTFPYNGHTTTSDMLWAGLPVLSVKGTAFAGRVSESLLKAIGLPELVAADGAAFVTEAVRLASDPYALTALRRRLEDNRFTAPLFDNDRFVRHLECAYERMAERARAGLKPDHIDVAALPARTGPFNA